MHPRATEWLKNQSIEIIVRAERRYTFNFLLFTTICRTHSFGLRVGIYGIFLMKEGYMSCFIFVYFFHLTLNIDDDDDIRQIFVNEIIHAVESFKFVS